jgi:glucokinase
MPHNRNTISRTAAEPPLFAGVDLGGTNIKLGIVDNLGRTLAYVSIPTDEPAGAESGVGRMADALQSAMRQAGLATADIAAIGLGSPGPLDLASGMLLAPVNMPRWHNFPLRDRLNELCNLPVTLANDASAAAYGEFWLGPRRSVASLVMLTLGTGIGGGIIVDGKSIDGAHSHGAECGHIIVDSRDDARMCGCGQRGHLEAYASGTALIKRTIEALETGMKTSLNLRLEQGQEITPRAVAEEAAGGDPLALELVRETARYLAIGIVTLLHTVDPDIVLLGGAMNFGGNETELGRQFLNDIRQHVRRLAFPLLAEQIPIEFAALGSDAGYLGAAGLARAAHFAAAREADGDAAQS